MLPEDRDRGALLDISTQLQAILSSLSKQE